MKHKWFCVLLAAIMIFCLFPSAVIAANTESTFTQAPSIFHITASCDDSNRCTAKVSARAAAGDSFQLFIAVYQADGKFIDVDCQTADFTSAEQTFTAAFSAVPTGAAVKAFFLSTDYRPLSSANAVITNAVASSIAQLARTHNVKQLSSVGSIEAFSDHWYADESVISEDLSNALGLAYSLTVSDVTSISSAPAAYDQNELIEWGKYPGLGIDVLHQLGYTGDGAVIAYVDQPLAQPLHDEYNKSTIHYTNRVTDGGGDNSMHGPAVLSLLAGETCGTAPDAEVYFYAHAAWKADQTTHADCLFQIIEQNKTLSDSQKIRMVGFSDNIDESEANADAFRAAVAACEDAGIMVWFCGEYGSASFLPLSEKNDPDNLTKASWGGNAPSLVYVPAGSRTTAATMGGAKYTYWSDGGLSWTMPYMLGVYAIALSVDPSLTQDDLRTLVVNTAYENSAGMRIANPVEMIACVLEGVGKPTDAAALRKAAAAKQTYLYALMDTAQLTEDDLTAIANYLSGITDATVLVVDTAQYANAGEVYDAIQTDHAQRGGTIRGIQIFGTPTMVPAFSVSYKVQMPVGLDEGGSLLTDLFYSNLNNDSEKIASGYNVCDHFANGWSVDLVPQWPVIRLPLSAGEYASFFTRYTDFVDETQLQKQTLVNFSNPIFASTYHTDDMGAFLNRMHNDLKLIDGDYLLYGNLRGKYPVQTSVIGGFTADNLASVNHNGIVEFLINSHGQQNKIVCCYYDGSGKEVRESLINSSTINSVLDENSYYLDCWTCNNGYGMADNLITTALKGHCVGAFAATSIISNNGVNCNASLADLEKSNFYYFYYQYLKQRDSGDTRAQAFFTAQKNYADVLMEDSANGIRGEGNYQFNLYNLLAYENFGVIEPNAAASAMYRNAGYIAQAGQSVPKDPGTGGGGGGGLTPSPLTNGTPIGTAWDVSFLVDDRCTIADQYTIYGLTAQQLDNNYIRLTLDYKAPAGGYVDAFNPPNGDIFMLYSSKTTGNRESFVYDLSYEDLQQINTVTMKFFGFGAEANSQYLFIQSKDICDGYNLTST